MKCYTVDGSGPDGLRLEEQPSPATPGAGQVLVDVHAVSLNYRDLMVLDGRYGPKSDRPFIACSDLSGVVAAVGQGVEGLAVGDRVLNAPFRCWPAGRMRSEWIRGFVGGSGVDGVLAQQVVYPATSLVKLPNHLSHTEGCTLTIAGLTAWAAVVTHGQVQPGQWVLVHGTGGVSLFAVQLAKLAGARVILSTSSQAKAKLVTQKFGVEHTFNYRDVDWPDQVRRFTQGEGVDIVVEVVGGESLSQSIQCCGYGGRVAVIGVLEGMDSPINIRDLLTHQVTVRGIFMESTQELRALAQAVESAGLRPCVDKIFGFEEASQAYQHLRSGQHMGKVVIQVLG